MRTLGFSLDPFQQVPPDGTSSRTETVVRSVAWFILAAWVALAAFATALAPNDAHARLLAATEARSLSLLPPLSHGLLVQEPSPAGGTSSEARIVFVTDDDLAARLAGARGTVLRGHRSWLGTDRIGRDLAVEIARGARVSLAVGLLAAALAVALGLGVGALSGLGPRALDAVLMRLVDGLLAFPLLLLVLLLDLLFEPGLMALIVLLGSTQWMGVSRVVRGEMHRLRQQPFILAARGIGVRGPRLFLRHLLPNAMQPILVSGLLLIGDSILLESAISFLGFGTASDLSSWGRLIASGRSFVFDAWWISAFPGLAIVLVVSACNLLGDAESHRRRRTPRRAAQSRALDAIDA